MEEKNDTVTETISLQNDNGCDFNTEFRKTNAPFSVCLCVCFGGGWVWSERVLFPVHLSQDIGCPVNGIREEHSRNKKKDERKTLLSVDRIENPSSKQS